MIFIMTDKAFTKNAKKLVKPMEYFIFDATDDDSAELTKYTNVISIGGFAPPNKLVKARNDSTSISADKLQKMEKKHFGGDDFVAPLLSIMKAFIDGEGNVNIFLILNRKTYKAYSKKIIKRFYKFYGVDFTFIMDIGDLKENKKSLSKEMSNKKVGQLNHIHKDILRNMSKKDTKKKKK